MGRSCLMYTRTEVVKSDLVKLDSARELAFFLGVSVAAVRKWSRLNSIPVLRCGRSVVTTRAAALKALQARHEKEGSNGS
jgi:hypothetical protein